MLFDLGVGNSRMQLCFDVTLMRSNDHVVDCLAVAGVDLYLRAGNGPTGARFGDGSLDVGGESGLSGCRRKREVFGPGRTTKSWKKSWVMPSIDRIQSWPP